MVDLDTILTQPSAAPVIQSLRNIGYNAQTAIADIVDNGIDAQANNIHITFEYDHGEGYIQIHDNGIGMTDEELQIAMTIGSKDPREERKQKELGRFGMGLKTASFSLGKRLSVFTKKDGVVSERCWDLDYVSLQNEWSLLKKIPDEVKDLMGDIISKDGTIIFVDKLDRFSSYGEKKVLRKESYFKKVQRVHKYLEMVFHVKLNEGLRITINNNDLFSWDPFLSEHSRTIEGEPQIIRVNGKKVRVQPYVLPHPSSFNESQYKASAGPKGWRDQQGFYIYRENRLVNFGEWFGLFTKDVASELVRIKVDFLNNADDDWKIDIKKSSISLPEDAKEDLKAIAKYYRQISKEIMLYRTKSTTGSNSIKGTLNTWELANDVAESPYILNRTHPILVGILKDLDNSIRKQLNQYLKLVELGSPNNLLQTSTLVRKEEMELDDNLKKFLIDIAQTLVDIQGIESLEQIVEAINMIAGFESINRNTIKEIIERDVFSGKRDKKAVY